ncbi:NAD(P)H-binding protein [Patulibacter sp.]|uniref:NAD(P)H-binding protein n=1 Tax=Patulibacter sp. TaxID=1912859 RepID=UPI002726AD37|nr:NAD(P)H-binding protein [Patulibacter sp.]MDO9406958.1 NAD(P)H-binding protein [Patulibacter sp.]
MKVFVFGITGGVGGLLATELLRRGDDVAGLVRREDQRSALRSRGIAARVGDLATMSASAIADAIRGSDVLVFSAGSNGGSTATTEAIDRRALATVTDAAGSAGVRRLASVSVLPESWRERDLDEELESYFTVKKDADVALSRSALDWLILRPSMLVDAAPTGTVSLGPAELHGEIARADVAVTLAELLHEPGIRRQILELNGGAVPIAEAVAANVRGGPASGR